MFSPFCLSFLYAYIIPPIGAFVNRFGEIFLFFYDLSFDDVCNYVVFDFFRPLVGKGDGHGRTVGNCPVEILPYVSVSCDDVAASAVDGGICTVLVTILLDGGAGDYAQQDDEGE